MQPVKIQNKLIGNDYPTFIMAEAGVNHNGSLKLAKKLVDVAVKAGVDAVKFQTYTTENVAIENANIADYAKKSIGKSMKQCEMLKKYEFYFDDFLILKKYCDKKKIIFLSTPHSFDAIDFLDEIVPAYKIGSGDITNIPALKHAAKKGKPMILGTGMSNMNEVKAAIGAVKSVGNDKVILLHCTTNYPCELNEVNLRAMQTLQDKLGCLVGYSDHTLGTIVPVMAVSLGAVVIEKHFTIDRDLPGPDHKASLIPDELKKMVKDIRHAEKALGSFEKKPTESEIKIMNIVRKSVVANKEIKKGTKISRNMLDIKRPGIGIKPEKIDDIIGRIALKDIKKDELIKWRQVR